MSAATRAHGASASAHGYASPYAAGAGLGVVLLASYILAGRGIGATGAFAVVAAKAIGTALPDVVAANTWLAERAAGAMLGDWLMLTLIA